MLSEDVFSYHDWEKRGSKMDTTEWIWKTHDGLKMYSKAWLPVTKTKAVVCLVHGVGEHIGRYESDAEALTSAGYILAGFDLRGFGKSEGMRGHTPSLDAYFEDIDMFLAEVDQRYPNLPRFLYGHSMGAVLVLGYVPLHQPEITGAIATGPALKTALETQKFKVFLAKVLGKLIPTLTMKSGIDVSMLSRDPELIEKYVNDPLVHTQVTASWGKSMLKAVEIVYKNAPLFPSPVLLMHGTNDEIAYPSSSISFAELAPKDMVTLKMWDGFKHELHTDFEKNEVFKVMVGWLNQHLPQKK
jgi:acylglycerol lipase